MRVRSSIQEADISPAELAALAARKGENAPFDRALSGLAHSLSNVIMDVKDYDAPKDWLQTFLSNQTLTKDDPNPNQFVMGLIKNISYRLLKLDKLLNPERPHKVDRSPPQDPNTFHSLLSRAATIVGYFEDADKTGHDAQNIELIRTTLGIKPLEKDERWAAIIEPIPESIHRRHQSSPKNDLLSLKALSDGESTKSGLYISGIRAFKSKKSLGARGFDRDPDGSGRGGK